MTASRSLLTLQSDLEDISTMKRLLTAVIQVLTKAPVTDTSPEVRRLFKSQQEIGWINFLEGRISTRWRHCYESWYTPNKNPAPSSWAAKFVSRIWKYSLALWNHRNEVVHGKDLAEREVIKQEEYLETFHLCINNSKKINSWFPCISNPFFLNACSFN